MNHYGTDVTVQKSNVADRYCVYMAKIHTLKCVLVIFDNDQC